jgi:hypothetical protein
MTIEIAPHSEDLDDFAAFRETALERLQALVVFYQGGFSPNQATA